MQSWNNLRSYKHLFKSFILDMTHPLRDAKLAGGDIWKRLYRNEIFWSSESCCGNLQITLDFMQNLTFKKMKRRRCVYGIETVRRHLDAKSKGWTASWTRNKAWNLRQQSSFFICQFIRDRVAQTLFEFLPSVPCTKWAWIFTYCSKV